MAISIVELNIALKRLQQICAMLKQRKRTCKQTHPK